MDVLKDSEAWWRDPDLDPDFGLEKGYFFPEPITPIVPRNIRAVVLSPDQSLNLASTSEDGKYQFSRADANGFPLAGFQPTSAGFESEGTSSPTRLLLQRDGKIIMIGTFTPESNDSRLRVAHPAITRFNANGTPDLVFERQVLRHPPEDATASPFPRKMADGCLQTDGKILIANVYQLAPANSSNYASKLTRLNSDGSRDSTFGNGGSIDVVFDGKPTNADHVQVQRDGKIIVAGLMISNGQHQLTLARYTTDGSPDLSFGDDGYAQYAVPEKNTLINQLVVHQDKLICAGSITGPQSAALLMRFDADGQIDPAFNDGMPVLTRDGYDNLQWACMSVQSSGRIVLAGTAQTRDGKESIVKRFLEDGRPDFGFTSAPKPISYSDIAIQTSGRLVLTAVNRSSYALAVGLRGQS
ncbi:MULTISPECIES: delta-60 repeat domain-containing protein [Pseudomonas]|uniref:delta-60 repeat domain-containing protein n=1 Tax=Pseudomonas TaxID=286 RepID=UPI001A9FD15A|nr:MULTISPECIES: delta-60 repeat domain-containing protein [unclassified Pseudomonas]